MAHSRGPWLGENPNPTPLAAGRYGRIALVAETAADARDVMVDGDSGLLKVHPRAFRPSYEPSNRRLTWPNEDESTRRHIDLAS